MIDNKAYAYDLVAPEIIPDERPNKKDFRIIKSPKTNQAVKEKNKAKTKPKSKLSLLISLLAIFTMFIIISIRYNLISEKNLELQRLKMEQTKINSELATTEVAIDKIIDKDTIEAYAKQQIGMQKPQKNQIVYINSDFDVTVKEVSNQNVFQLVLNKLKNIIK